MKLLWRGMCRVYFNAWADAPLYWSVDDGDPATEVKCRSVRIIRATCETVVAPEQKAQPRAWLCFTAANVWQFEDEIVIGSYYFANIGQSWARAQKNKPPQTKVG